MTICCSDDSYELVDAKHLQNLCFKVRNQQVNEQEKLHVPLDNRQVKPFLHVVHTLGPVYASAVPDVLSDYLASKSGLTKLCILQAAAYFEVLRAHSETPTYQPTKLADECVTQATVIYEHLQRSLNVDTFTLAQMARALDAPAQYLGAQHTTKVLDTIPATYRADALRWLSKEPPTFMHELATRWLDTYWEASIFIMDNDAHLVVRNIHYAPHVSNKNGH